VVSTRDGRAERLDVIQALRGIAALAVVGFHARFCLGAAGERLFGSGYAGVDLFFVISGFIMVHTTAGAPPAGTFLKKRIARIWPVYVIATLAYVLVRYDAASYVTPSHLRALAKAFVFYPHSRTGAPWLGFAPDEVGWTLNYEVFFYLLFAISLACGRIRWGVLAALFFGLLIATPLLAGHAPKLDAYGDYGLHPAILELAANPLMWEFLAGVAIALIYRSRLRIERRAARAVLVGVAIAVAVAQYVTQYRWGYGLPRMGAALAVLVLVLVLQHKERPIAVPSWLRWLGDISFSLYLFHRVAQIAIARLCWGTRLQPALDTAIFFVVSTALALVLAQLSYVWLERGLSERLRRALV
jgi:peptidoglycan/LPS O-acetylase OafA/YrhL